MNNQTVIKKFTSLGAAYNWQLGFSPMYVKIIRTNSSDTYLEGFEWWGDGNMDDAFSIKSVATGAHSTSATSGFTAYAGTAAGNKKGITLGADIMGATSDVVYMLAIRGSDDT